jgi:hypothetical protein
MRRIPPILKRLAISFVILVLLGVCLALSGKLFLDYVSPYIAFSRYALGQVFTWGVVFEVLALGLSQRVLLSRRASNPKK